LLPAVGSLEGREQMFVYAIVPLGVLVLGGLPPPSGDYVQAHATAACVNTVANLGVYNPGHLAKLSANSSVSADWRLRPGRTATATFDWGAWETCSLSNWTSYPEDTPQHVVYTGLTGTGQLGPFTASVEFSRALTLDDAGPDPVEGATYNFFTKGYGQAYIRCPDVLDSYELADPVLSGSFTVKASEPAPPGGGPGGGE
jgi:hypothetical protein